MPREFEIILRRSIALEHPRWTCDQITAAVSETADQELDGSRRSQVLPDSRGS